MNPYGLSQVNKKLTYTCQQLKDIHTKKLHTLRMFRATHLFCDTPEKEEEPADGAAGPKEIKFPIPTYPSISEEKEHLNSILTDPSAKDVISLSCFSRPMNNRAQKAQSNKAEAFISPVAMQRLGYNFRLVSKQTENRIGEIQEIESIQRDLARKEIHLGNRTLQKAIIYDNERDTIKRFGSKPPVEGEAATKAPVEEDEEFIVKYPGAGDHLLVNPFAVKEKPKKKKKK